MQINNFEADYAKKSLTRDPLFFNMYAATITEQMHDLRLTEV